MNWIYLLALRALKKAAAMAVTMVCEIRLQSLGNNKDFARLRIGIGHPGNAKQVADYVLKKASPAINNLLPTVLMMLCAHFPWP